MEIKMKKYYYDNRIFILWLKGGYDE